METGKTGKYLKYAIGEVVLVVIGILIALSINNWNENKKLEKVEIKTLNELKSDLVLSYNDIKDDSLAFSRSKRANELIIHHIENKTPYHDSLNVHFRHLFHYATFSIVRTTYNNISQTGSNIISNDSIRLKLSVIYDRWANLYKEMEERYLELHYSQNINPMILKDLELNDNNISIPRDFEAFGNKNSNIQALKFSVGMFEEFMDTQKAFMIQIQTLVELIGEEIIRLEQ